MSNLFNSVRNCALTTQTFDAEFLLQISLGGEPLITVGQPSGPGGTPTVFIVWEGSPEDDSEDRLERFKVDVYGSVDKAWEAAVRHGYEQALVRAFKARKVLAAAATAIGA